jgi:replicative DNA helicase
MKLDLIEKVYGAILAFIGEEQREILNRIKPEYLTKELHKRTYKAMKEIVKEKKAIDLVSLTMKYKELGYLDKNVVVYLSKLTSDNFSLVGAFSVNNIFAQLEAEKVYSEAVNFSNSLNNLLNPEEFTIEKYNNLISEAKAVTYQLEEKIESNVDTIFTILKAHNKAKEGELVGLELPYFNLKGVVILEPCDMLVVGARPAMGKTAYAVDVATKLAINGKRVALFSLEMSKEQVLRRVVANLTGINSNKIKYGECSSEEIDLIFKAQALENLSNLIVIDGTQSINDITRIVYDLKAKGGLDLFIVDYLQKVQVKASRSRYEAVTEISNGIKLISQNYGVPSLALAQLSRESSKIGKRPTLPDLKESGEIEQDASIVAFLHRPEYYGENETYSGLDATGKAEVIIAKNREGELGIFEYEVDLSTSKFSGIHY